MVNVSTIAESKSKFALFDPKQSLFFTDGELMAFRENLERMARIYEGVAIFSVERGSTTHRAGIRAGDILMSVNGRRIRHHSEYSGARRLRAECIELVVMRQGREIRLWATGQPSPAKTEQAALETPAEPPPQGIASVTWRGAA